MNGEVLKLAIVNDVAELPRMTHWLVHGASAAGLHEDVVSRLETCAYEAAVNIMSYAYENAGRHDIRFELSVGADGARLVVRDDGRPFNPLAFEEAPQPASIAEAPVGGLGIRLIRRLMAHCEYRREDGCNVLVMETGPAADA